MIENWILTLDRVLLSEVHEDTLRGEGFPSYSMMKNQLAEFNRGRERDFFTEVHAGYCFRQC